jgi:hypothetical protein
VKIHGRASDEGQESRVANINIDSYREHAICCCLVVLPGLVSLYVLLARLHLLVVA